MTVAQVRDERDVKGAESSEKVARRRQSTFSEESKRVVIEFEVEVMGRRRGVSWLVTVRTHLESSQYFQLSSTGE